MGPHHTSPAQEPSPVPSPTSTCSPAPSTGMIKGRRDQGSLGHGLVSWKPDTGTQVFGLLCRDGTLGAMMGEDSSQAPLHGARTPVLVSSLLSGEPRRQVDGRFEEGYAPGNTLPEWPCSSGCVLVWAALSSAFNGALCFRRGWRITRLCAREDRSGGPQVGTWLSDPEGRTGTNKLVPDTGAPPDPAHHSSPQPWPSQGLHMPAAPAVCQGSPWSPRRWLPGSGSCRCSMKICPEVSGYWGT